MLSFPMKREFSKKNKHSLAPFNTILLYRKILRKIIFPIDCTRRLSNFKKKYEISLVNYQPPKIYFGCQQVRIPLANFSLEVGYLLVT